jgi:hypothetical protein
MKVSSLMYAVIFLNLAAFSIHISGVFPVTRELWVNPTDITNTFNLTVFAVLGAGGAVIGVLGALFHTYTFAAGAILLWVIGIIMPIAQWFIGGLPIMMAALLPAELAWFSVVVGAVFAMSFFLFIVEIAAGRQIT